MSKKGLPSTPDESEIAKIALEQTAKANGWTIADVEEFVKGIELRRTTPFAEMVSEAQQIIDAYDPQLLSRSGIDSDIDFEARLKKLYSDPEHLESALNSFKVMFHHIAYFLEKNNTEELRHAIEECRNILNGNLYGEENQISRGVANRIENAVN